MRRISRVFALLVVAGVVAAAIAWAQSPGQNPFGFPPSSGSATPSGAAGGDLSGTYPNPTVAKINGNAVAAGSPTAGQVLGWDGSQWTGENTANLTSINGIGTLAIAASGTITFIGSDSFISGETWKVCDATPRCVIFTATNSGGSKGSGGGDCAAWPCTYTIPMINNSLTATQVACLQKDIVNVASTCGLGPAFPNPGLAMTATSASTVTTLTDTAGGTSGNCSSSTCTETVSNVGFVWNGMSGGANTVTSTITIGGSNSAAQVATAVSILPSNGTTTIGVLSVTGAATVSSLKTTNLLVSSTTPTISSGFGTGAAISFNNGTAAFRISVGTSSANTGVIGLPTASTGWNCFCQDITTLSGNVHLCRLTTSSTTSATIGNFKSDSTAGPWTDNDVLEVSCFAY